jgi:hypothetical protein
MMGEEHAPIKEIEDDSICGTKELEIEVMILTRPTAAEQAGLLRKGLPGEQRGSVLRLRVFDVGDRLGRRDSPLHRD